MKNAFDWVDGEHFGLLSDRPEKMAERSIKVTLQSPVAQDLLITNLGYPDQKSPNIGYVQSRFYDLPRTTRNVAIASGAIDGTRPSAEPDILTVQTGKASSRHAKARFGFRALVPSSTEETTTFSGALSFRSVFDTSLRWGKRVRYTGTFRVSPWWAENYDRAPCSQGVDAIDNLATDLDIMLSEVWDNRSVVNEGGAACLIPTYSALIGNSRTGEDDYRRSLFDEVIGDSTNKNHLDTTPTMDAKILLAVGRTFLPRENTVRGADGRAIDGRASSTRNARPSQVAAPSDLAPPSAPAVSFSEETVYYEDEGGNIATPADLNRAGIVD